MRATVIAAAIALATCGSAYASPHARVVLARHIATKPHARSHVATRTFLSARPGRIPYCKKGKLCGGSCIVKWRVCHK
jgi:hypothetical protein